MSWDRVQRTFREMDDRLRAAETEEQCQAVGGLAREVLISLAQAVYDRDLHGVIENGTVPSDTDARRMLEAYIERELQGGANEETRRFAKAESHWRRLSRTGGQQHVERPRSVPWRPRP